MRRRQTILVSLLVAAVIILAAAWIWYPRSAPGHPILTAAGDVQVDRFSGTLVGGPEGIEPDVAVAPNGTIGIVWIGFTPIVPTLYFNQTSNFNTEIWYAESGDGGQTYSSPQLVSGGCNECVDPSLVYGQNGTVFVCYLATPSTTHAVMLSFRVPGQTGFANVTVATGSYIDRPWIAQETSGTIEVTYDSPNGIYLTDSPEAAPHFSTGALVLNLDGLVASFGVAPSGADYFGVLTGQVDFATLAAGGTQAALTETISINVSGALGTQTPTLSKPGPSVAESESETFLTYVSNNDTALWLVTSTDSGATWSGPQLIASTANGTIAMPELAVNAAGNALIIVWLSGDDGSWNTYAAVLSPQSDSLSSLVRVSSENGYSNDVRSWHGDFQGVAFVGNSTAVVAWSDGRRGILPDVGYGHVYSSVVTVATS